jgi:uncharacterized protein (TIGR00255 family)
MTGFGQGRAAAGEEDLSVELRSVNHKFCEVKARLPRELASLEPVVGKLVRDRLARGAVEVLVKRNAASSLANAPFVDVALAQEYRKAYSALAKALNLADDVRLSEVATQPGVIRLEERAANLEAATAVLEKALSQALDKLIAMRQTEGEAMRADLTQRLQLVETAAREVQGLAPQVVDEYRKRLEERVAALSKGLPVEPTRLAQEVAFFAERTDVAEEMTRLSSHLAQFRALLTSKEPAGRKMDFLVQEMHREVNTTGSKSQHPDISSRVVAMKAELERIREQVQNVE